MRRNLPNRRREKDLPGGVSLRGAAHHRAGRQAEADEAHTHQGAGRDRHRVDQGGGHKGTLAKTRICKGAREWRVLCVLSLKILISSSIY